MKKDDYISDLEEWQQHQYSKGYYTGSKMPPIVKYSGLSDKDHHAQFSSTILVFFGFCSMIASFIGIVIGSESRIMLLILLSVLFGLGGVVLCVVGLRQPDRKRAMRKRRRGR